MRLVVDRPEEKCHEPAVRRHHHVAPGSPEEAYRQLRELADKAALVNLSVLYSMAVDDHDLDTVVACFAPAGASPGSAPRSAGTAQLRDFYGSMMDRYVTTLHTPESHVAVVDVDAGTATGVVNGHGELALGDRLLLAAYRYDDRVRAARRPVGVRGPHDPVHVQRAVRGDGDQLRRPQPPPACPAPL
jgi:hypothetical protein